MKIYDCFQFYNEFDLLEIRFELLYDYVDYFVISETNRTHSDLPKPYYFEEKKNLFEKYKDKIIHIKQEYPTNILNLGKKEGDSKFVLQFNKISEIYDKEANENQLKSYPTFCRDYLQREFLKLGLIDCNEDDLIMVSDLDELSNPESISYIRKNNITNKCLWQGCYYFHVNTLAHTNWYGAYVVSYKDIDNVSLTHIRGQKSPKMEGIRNGGWHFSFVGGVERVKDKIKSYSHQEFNNSFVLSQIESRMSSGIEPLGRSNNMYYNPNQTFYYEKMLVHDLNDTTIYPEKLSSIIKEKFPYLIKNESI
jgi:beta-1,4-mannosyl-glycoprotein beta-1,4-N-acetylglucosaminyltransferase